ncbi:RING-H2 finger protein ATL66-like [Actinidia eriantha]|uniref:RING-H2 finger protein ATL66-like n=1 Tax=Actinidia eriantha TaxID=165200 RepID=UPI0025876392|nr:RING-H2 finger protein ATL66-like [Actinidia eriantha]
MASQEFQASPWNFTDLNHTLLQHHTLGLLLIVILFSILLLIAFLYFYHHFISLHTHSFTNSITAPPLPSPAAQPPGLDSTTINNLPIFLHRSLNTTSSDNIAKEISECSICLGLFEDEEIIKVLPECQHAYHSDCVDKWLSTRSSCPLCRASLQQFQSPAESETTQVLQL